MIFNDPVLPDEHSYFAARRAAAKRQATSFSSILNDSEACQPSVRDFVRSVRAVCSDRSQLSVGDPYYSTSIRAWVDGLARGLKWIDIGADSGCLSFYADEEAFLSDVKAEFPALSDTGGGRVERIGENLYVVAADSLAASPRLKSRIQECLPGYPNSDYVVLGRDELAAAAKHIDGALGLLRDLDRETHELLEANVHTIFVAIHFETKVSMGTRFDCPGTVVVGLSEERIANGDIAATAAQLYHEHCHLKLALYLAAEGRALDRRRQFVSPFKNDLRELETMLHTAYTIAAECHVRTALADHLQAAASPNLVAYLVALSARLELTAHACTLAIDESFPLPLQRVPKLAHEAVEEIDARLQRQDPFVVTMCAKERDRVHERHRYDVAQFLLRGHSVIDGYASEASMSGDTVSLGPPTTPHTYELGELLPSIGGYGRYMEHALSQ